MTRGTYNKVPAIKPASETLRELGKAFRIRRGELNLSLKDLGQMTGLNPSYIARIEKDELEHAPSNKVLKNLGDALGVEVC